MYSTKWFTKLSAKQASISDHSVSLQFCQIETLTKYQTSSHLVIKKKIAYVATRIDSRPRFQTSVKVSIPRRFIVLTEVRISSARCFEAHERVVLYIALFSPRYSRIYYPPFHQILTVSYACFLVLHHPRHQPLCEKYAMHSLPVNHSKPL